MQIIPCLAPLEDQRAKEFYSLTPQAYGAFLKQFFAIWAKELYAGNYVSVRLFDNLVRMAMGERPEQCGLLGNCAPQFVVEADGGVYLCDFYVLDEYRCGNVLEHTIGEIYRSDAMRRFLMEGSRHAHVPLLPYASHLWRRMQTLPIAVFLRKALLPPSGFSGVLSQRADQDCRVCAVSFEVISLKSYTRDSLTCGGRVRGYKCYHSNPKEILSNLLFTL